MRSDVEVGKGRSPASAPPSVPDEALSGEEGGFPGQRESHEISRRQRVLEFLDSLEADRDLGVHEWVYGQL
jgi:hypothetical protein